MAVFRVQKRVLDCLPLICAHTIQYIVDAALAFPAGLVNFVVRKIDFREQIILLQ